jgi:Bacterial Ig-like domain (group 3)
MRSNKVTTMFKNIFRLTIVLLLGAMAFGQGTTTTTTLTASASTIALGQSDTFRATVSTTVVGFVPTGTVTFYNSTVTQLGAPVTLDGTGAASLTTSTLPAGSDSITAVYSGDGTYAGDTSNAVPVTVTLLPTSTTLTASSSTIFAGQSDTLKATVSNTGVVPTGTVTFYNNTATQLGAPVTLDSTGAASLVTFTLPVGSDSITAVYSGDGTYAGDTSNAVVVTVNADPTATGSPSGDVTVVTLTNTSSSLVTFTLNIPSNFSIGTGGTCPASLQLSAGSCTVNLQATDQTGQSQSGTLSITAVDGSGVPVNVIGGGSLAVGSGVIPAAGETGSEQVVTLTAAQTTTTLPDGQVIPMWGYSCGARAVNSGATCRNLNPDAVGWSPVVITVPSGQDLEIELTNKLTFTPTGSATSNNIPTSIVIVGQVGGGLGSARTTTPSPDHSNAQGCVTWFIADPTNTPPGVPCPQTATTPVSGAYPPTQGPRVQSFGTEVAAGTTADLIWKNPRPGTYLLESGTHPSIQVPMGLIGVLVVTTAPSGATAGTAYPAVGTAPAVTYNAELPLEFSEIDPVQNNAVNAAVNTAGFNETKVWDGHLGACGNPNSPVGVVNTCYPPAVNYTPFYYLINGLAFNKTNAPFSVFPATANGIGTSPPVVTGITGTVLVRLVNAGLRMHVPSIVGSQTQGFSGAGAPATVSGFSLIAEDGNVIPGVQAPGAASAPAAPRVQTDVFMAAGKTFDVMINVPATPSGATTPPSLPVYDRELSLSANSSARDAGMLAYIGVNGAGLPLAAAGTGVFAAAQANNDSYVSVPACTSTATSCLPLVVSDVSKGVIANDVNVYGVQLLAGPTHGTLTCTSLGNGLCTNGTFTYTPTSGSTFSSDTFSYCANNGLNTTVTPATCTTTFATVTLGASKLTGNPTAIAQSYTAKMATYLKIPSPGLLLGNTDPNNLPLTVVPSTSTSLVIDQNGGFWATGTAGTPLNFSYTVQNSLGNTATGTASVTFPQGNGPTVNVVDALAYNNCNGDSVCISHLVPITDYRWIIEEDKTFWVDPNCTTTGSITAPGCPHVVGPTGTTTIPTQGVQFHTSTMDYVAQGCTGPKSCEGGQTFLNPATGTHDPAVCDVGNGACRPDTTGNGFTAVMPGSVHLDPSKRYYISVLPGDAGDPFPATVTPPDCSSTTGANPGDLGCGHTMGGAQIPPLCNVLTAGCTATSGGTFAAVTVLSAPTPLPTGKLSLIVFEDDFPLNGEQDAGGGVDVLSPNEPGLGGFEIILWDTYGSLGDVTGQDTHDMFNMPLSNSLAGTIDPSTGLDACPISAQATADPTQAGITGRIVTCPKYESDNATLSPLAGQAVVANLMADKFSVQAYPGADRIARGEEWLQTNTLDGQHPHDSFIRIGEPSYFQEYGPAGYHVSIGFANPKIINDRHDAVCAGSFGAVGSCNNTIKGQVDVQRLSRTPDQRLYPSGSRDALAWTQCWVSLGDPDAEDFMFAKCDANGNFKFTGVPGGNWRLTIGDQWNDQIIDGLSTPANVSGGQTLDMGQIGVQQWQANVYTRTFVDDNKNGIRDDGEIGIPLVYTMIHYRDGSRANVLTTDFDGVANFNETFPLFNWYVVTADSGRYKTTGIHTVYDAGGPADGTTYCGPGNGARPCGTSTDYNFLANTFEAVPLPVDLSVPGAVYCVSADCKAEAAGFAAGTSTSTHQLNSTGRIDPPWVAAEGWSGETSQGNWIEFGKAPFASCNPALPASATNFCVSVPNLLYNPTAGGTTASTVPVGENGGIHGLVKYAATRPFDDASQMIEQPWAPNVPRVTINLYQEGFAADGATPTLTLVDTTQSTSWDDWAQGFYPNSTAGGTGATAGQKPYMNCPGQGTATGANADLFFFTLFDQPNYLNYYNSLHGGPALSTTTLPYNSQYKCYDAMHIWNQIQPAPYDGMYSFPSVLGINPTTGKLLAVKGSTNGVASSMTGTNCTICVANPDTTDNYRNGTPMLPPGKYVVETIMPPGYEVEKEEDKNLLIGDNYIAPATQQFPGLGGSIFIIPDQASVASLYDESAAGYNPTNYQNSTTAEGNGNYLALPGYPGFQDPIWPCVGEMRVVPDYLSLFPQVKETAPFAGATRPLCDRKEVTLASQDSVSAKFYIFTSTHIASHFTGVITDDFTSEFDPFSPQFGEKFSPPNMPISTRDYLGNEVSRVYSDHWGIYDGLNFSSWDVNPPNITGYSPAMMVQCMNDYGPILDTNLSSPTHGQLINDPLYNQAYSDFCYTEPYMPGTTTYLDTPVVPTQAFVGAGYNNPDCAYPEATPAIAEVDGDGIGPYVSAAGHTLTITALGNATVANASSCTTASTGADVAVNNFGYAGPSASVAPFDCKTVTRHYGFGTCSITNAACTNGASAALMATNGSGAKVPLNLSSWSDTSIVGTIPTAIAQNPNFACAVQQQAQYGGSNARCGQLVITAGNGKQSIDTVTVTVGGKAPTHVAASGTIQGAIDAAAPGDLIIVDPTCSTTTGGSAACTTPSATNIHSPASHTEMVIMWKPVRLQGAGAASTIINANTIPAGKLLDPWRRHVNCLFGLTPQGVPSTGVYAGCPEAGWNYFTAQPNVPQIDRLPLEATVGWDATLNGNLAELLQEPSLLGAYEGAGITVLGKGLDFHGQSDGAEGAFPAVTTLLTGVVTNPGGTPGTPGALQVGDANPLCHTSANSTTNPFPSNYVCNPSSIDGLTITNSSQGGGGIFVHGWGHFLQIANNRVYNNAGTLSGGISVGQGEFGPPYVQGSATNTPPGSCSNGAGLVTNQHLPMCLQVQANVHNNMIIDNSSIGDELFSATLSGGGGVSFCTGNDYYKFNFNWVCGNISAGEGGGMVHLGEIFNGDIEHNSFVFNESSNPTIPTNGGGIMIQGTPDTDPVCGTIPDADCPSGLSDGTGPGLVINANLIQGNSADSGSGGGIRLQSVNGTEVSTFASQPQFWHDVTISNNMIVNNMAGWDGAGISLQDALKVNIVNNTIMHNDTLASSGVLTFSIGAPSASAPAGECHNAAGTASCPQSAGVTSTPNSALLRTTFVVPITCPAGHPNCKGFSNPILFGDLIYQNRSFNIGVGTVGTGTLNQQNQVSLFNAFANTPAPTQAATGACSTGVTYWDLGVRGDLTTAPNSGSGFALNPVYSFLSSTSGYSGTGTHNSTSDPAVTAQYCNGSRVPPECTVADGCGGLHGFGVPPGIPDSIAGAPLFSLVPSATVDEGNNWINVSWGPLSLTNPSLTGGVYGNYGGGPALGNYSITASSPAVGYIPCTNANAISQGCNVQPFGAPGFTLPRTDFFGNPRPDPGTPSVDVGAVEVLVAGPAAPTLTSISPTSGRRGTVVPVTLTGTNLTGATAINVSGTGITVSNITATATTVTATFTISATAAATARTVSVTTPGGTSNTVTFTVTTSGTLAFTSATNGTLATVLGVRTLTFTIPTPRAPVTSVVTITNTGATPLTIGTPALSLNIGGLYSITASTCAGATVAPAGTCTISIRYATPTTRPSFPDIGALSVPNSSATSPAVLGLVAQ